MRADAVDAYVILHRTRAGWRFSEPPGPDGERPVYLDGKEALRRCEGLGEVDGQIHRAVPAAAAAVLTRAEW